MKGRFHDTPVQLVHNVQRFAQCSGKDKHMVKKASCPYSTKAKSMAKSTGFSLPFPPSQLPYLSLPTHTPSWPLTVILPPLAPCATNPPALLPSTLTPHTTNPLPPPSHLSTPSPVLPSPARPRRHHHHRRHPSSHRHHHLHIPSPSHRHYHYYYYYYHTYYHFSSHYYHHYHHYSSYHDC